MIRSEKMVLRLTNEVDQWLNEATKIYDQALYFFRQEFFKARDSHAKPKHDVKKTYALLKETNAWKSSTLDYNAKQYVLRKAQDNFKAFYAASKSYHKCKVGFTGKPALPKYLKDRHSTILVFDKTRLKDKDDVENTLSLPKSKYKIQIPKYIMISSIRCITIKRHYGKVKLCIHYNKEAVLQELNKDNWIGIDVGVENLVAITASNQEKSWIAKGGIVKSINQFYNKKLALIKSQLAEVNNKKTSKRLMRLGMKRENKINYAFHCLSKKIVGLCIDNNIGSIVIGRNKGWKQEVNLNGRSNVKKNTQNFVSIPFYKLIHMIQYKAEEVGIDVVLTEESYTSKVDHLAGESLEHHIKFVGERTSRGLFKSLCGKTLNADINGAIGMLRKANAISDARLTSLRDRGDVVSPIVLKYGL